MGDVVTVEAPSVAAFTRVIVEAHHEFRGDLVATEQGRPWARVNLSPMTDHARAAFPVDAEGFRGDMRKRGQSGVMLQGPSARHAASVVTERARRMHDA